MNTLDPLLREFILFCVERRGAKWPALYDEMAVVANQRLFKGMSYPELKKMGFSLAASNVGTLIRFVDQVVSQHNAN